MKIGQREIHLAHLYNPGAMESLPIAVRTAERLGYEVDILIQRDGQGKIHSLQVFASRPEEQKS